MNVLVLSNQGLVYYTFRGFRDKDPRDEIKTLV